MLPITLRLSRSPWLSDADASRLVTLLSERQRVLLPKQALERVVGTQPQFDVLLSGLAIRCRYLDDGRRSVTSLIVPGDTCDFAFLHGVEDGTSLVALTGCTLGSLTRDQVGKLAMDVPDVLQALWRESAVEGVSHLEWCVSLGSRTAVERICHLYHDAYVRLDAVGLVVDGSFHFPLTQDEVADRTGMTTVHANRVLKLLRDTGIVDVRGRTVTVPDVAILANRAHVDLGGQRPAPPPSPRRPRGRRRPAGATFRPNPMRRREETQ